MSILAGVISTDGYYDEDGDNASGIVIVDCSGCDFVIDISAGDHHCEGHEKECPNYGLDAFDENFTDCECEIFYHPHCCPICTKIEKEIRDYEQHKR